LGTLLYNSFMVTTVCRKEVMLDMGGQTMTHNED